MTTSTTTSTAPPTPTTSAPPTASTAASGAHPAGASVRRLRVVPDLDRPVAAGEATGDREDGSLVAEYGLLAVVAATVAGVLISWASSGALADFFSQLLSHARSLVVG